MPRPKRDLAAAALVAALIGPQLDGEAACAGRSPLFDAHVDGETPSAQARRHEVARSICRSCPARTPCNLARIELGDRAEGIWAGRLGRSRRAA